MPQLILTRKSGESIMIGDDVTVTVLDSKRKGQTRLMINAPKPVAVHRKEIAESIENVDRELVKELGGTA